VFDDCQDIVKAVSNDLTFKRQYKIGTVNSINWARLLAQVVYYFAGYFQATQSNEPKVSFTVPSGNFGNICAGHVARMMGLPIEQSGGGHQRKRCARRIFPHRHLPGARQRRHL
jgi:threonine synthase